MNKNTKIFLLIFIGLSLILILGINIFIKGYESEVDSRPLLKQERIGPIESPKKEGVQEEITEFEEIELEGPLSGPLLY